ncbi:uncharacterized protein LOC123503451 [Portunus trituberculatus]|uniref:uncharacterized protein LOC123503451 n=1 Tax=Portunus trituberculatus TaxID=210409 RepID=UPI001E1CE4E3|nr:uncharacterized protein LOC123503451 [Portunus trituberculatus]
MFDFLHRDCHLIFKAHCVCGALAFLLSSCRPTTCDLVVASRNWREFRVGLIVNTDFVYLIFLNPVCSLSKCWGRECQLVEEMATATTQVVQGSIDGRKRRAGSLGFVWCVVVTIRLRVVSFVCG